MGQDLVNESQGWAGYHKGCLETPEAVSLAKIKMMRLPSSRNEVPATMLSSGV